MRKYRLIINSGCRVMDSKKLLQLLIKVLPDDCKITNGCFNKLDGGSIEFESNSVYSSSVLHIHIMDNPQIELLGDPKASI